MGWPITPNDVREELKWEQHSGEGPDELTIWANAAVSRIEREIGQHSGQQLTIRVRAATGALVLPWPTASIQSVSVDGQAQDISAYYLDVEDQILEGTFPAGAVVIALAPDTVAPEVELATRYLAATWARQSRVGPPSARTRAADPDGDVLQGFAMPRRVSEMIRPYVLTGFA